ncbi:asparaginase [Thalassovita taeanensis]|uniref:Asparaginase n=1 Tax=Thalassovita taeanensis TaxID=657014 RepID=A0A1H9DTS3_9RHOB|nr:asparaginase [Thalassovita taeanensis]SEQ16835.1 asparaginase [Thalassovita taeanensis]
MANPVPMAEIWRGAFLESVHHGHAVICDESGQIVQAWGDPHAVVLPRSSSKMLQALPLVESGAADAFGLGQEQLALACASHQGAAIHTDRVRAWLDHIGKSDDDFRCGAQEPSDKDAREALIRGFEQPCQYHNNCSGKHSGFLTLTRHLGAGPEYVDPSHPVQAACLEAFEDVTGATSPGFGIDGCSAPNHATTLHGMARAMAFFAAAEEGQGARASAAARLRNAMVAYPELVAGEGRACTELMRAMNGRVALKTGAEAFFIAIIPERKLGVALKITDGTTRGAECAIAAILVKLGLLEADHPATLKRMNTPIRNWNGIETGALRPASALL